MARFSRSHLTNDALLHGFDSHLAQNRTSTADLLADLVEIEERKLFVPAGYSSLYAYCLGEKGLSEDATSRRIHAARAARNFPAIFYAVADGRLHLTAVGLLAPHLTPENGDELLNAAANKTKAEIQQLLAERFPRTEMMTMVQSVPAPACGPVEEHALAHTDQHAPAHTAQHALAHVEVRPKVTPLAPERVAIQLTMSRRAYDQLVYVQALLSHQIPSGDLAEVLEKVIDVAVPHLEKRKFAATSKPRPSQKRSNQDGRYVPADVKRTVWERDGGRCTFVSEDGHRCESRRRLEFDHIEPVARGGQSTVGNLRLRCRAHNQFEAERAFSPEFMSNKRHEARRAAESRVTAVPAKTAAPTKMTARDELSDDPSKDVMAGLRDLGFRMDEARSATEFAARLQSATLEERMRAALQFLGRRFRPQRIAFVADGDIRSSMPMPAASSAS